MFLQNDIPQADNLSKVIDAVEAVGEGATTFEMISEAIGYSERQGRYYRHAAEVLGFVYNQNNFSTLTPLGQHFVESNPVERRRIIKEALQRNSFFKFVINFVESKHDGFAEADLIKHILSNTTTDSEITIHRRVKTVLSWLLDVSIIFEDGDYYRYNDKLEEDGIDNDPENLKFSSSTYDQEVDIKEEWFSVYELNRKLEQKKIIMNPDFQRNLVWKHQQKSQFIESIILNIPLPPLYFRKELNGDYIVVDGLQRTSAIQDFLLQKFSLGGLEALFELNNCNFQNLETRLQARIEDRKLLVYILQPQVPMKVVYDIFNRINTGGTKLERQEIRNCIFIGKSTELLKELSESNEFKQAIDYGISPTRMKDREAVLRCLAFTIFDYESDYKYSMDEFLERTMKKINSMDDNLISFLRNKFLHVMGLTFSIFGRSNFRLPTDYSRGRINIAVLESIYYYFSENIDQLTPLNEHIILENFSELINDEKYLNSVKYSTGSNGQVNTRFRLAKSILSGNLYD